MSKTQKKNKRICVVGLGYVGLPLAVSFSEKYDVIGYDISKSRVDELGNGIDNTLSVRKEDLERALKEKLKCVTSICDAKSCDIYIITVPTPIDKNKKPDLFPLISASERVGGVLSVGNIVIYESTVYPGTTEDVCVPVLELNSGLKYNDGFYCGYSPERISPGDIDHTFKSIKKVTSGSTMEIGQFIDGLYNEVVTAGTYLAPSIKVAEASKVLENTQRDLNISLMNEMAMFCNGMDINVSDVIDAASTKWNFHKYTPGLVGGHCIGVDPYYLIHGAEKINIGMATVIAARNVNEGMVGYVIESIAKEIPIINSKILIMGATFKKDCVDMRNSKSIDLGIELQNAGGVVNFYDPLVQDPDSLLGMTISKKIGMDYDCVILAVKHSIFEKYDREWFEKSNKIKALFIDIEAGYKSIII